MRNRRKSTVRTAAVKAGFRSGLEHRVWKNLIQRKVKGAAYEPIKISYVIPLSEHSYTPDIVLANGIILEVKGRLVKADRDKHLLIKEQYPDIDLRFVFQNANNKIRKGIVIEQNGSNLKTAYWDYDKNEPIGNKPRAKEVKKLGKDTWEWEEVSEFQLQIFNDFSVKLDEYWGNEKPLATTKTKEVQVEDMPF